MKNIRQVYSELETRYNELAEAHLTLQRTLKRIILTQEDVPDGLVYYSHKVGAYYTDRELDAMEIKIFNAEEMERMELSI